MSASSNPRRRCWLWKLIHWQASIRKKVELVQNMASTRKNVDKDPSPRYEHIEKAPARPAACMALNLGSATTISMGALPYTDGLDPNVNIIGLTLDTILPLLLPPPYPRCGFRKSTDRLLDAVDSVKLVVTAKYPDDSCLDTASNLWSTENLAGMMQRLDATVTATKACVAALSDCSCTLVRILNQEKRDVQNSQCLLAAYACSIVANLAHQSAQESITAAVGLANASAACMSPSDFTILAEAISSSRSLARILKRACKDTYEATSNAYLQYIRHCLQEAGVILKTHKLRISIKQMMSVSVSVRYDLPKISIAAVDRDVTGASVAVSVAQSAFSAAAGSRRVFVIAAAVEPTGQGSAMASTEAPAEDLEASTNAGNGLKAVVCMGRSNARGISAFGGGVEALNLVRAVFTAIRKYGL